MQLGDGVHEHYLCNFSHNRECATCDGMDWLRSLNEAVNYIEEHLTEEIDLNKLGKIAGCSGFERITTSCLLYITFGEFLAADFILRYTISAVREMYYNRKFNMTTAIEKNYQTPTRLILDGLHV